MVMRNAVLPVLGSSILAMVATAALAADLPSRSVPPVFLPPPIPAFSWTGFYVGANAGAAFGQRRQGTYVFSNAGGANTIAGSGGTDGVLALGGGKTGFAGGGQIGYNYQFNPGPSVVAGVEADAQYLGVGSSTTNYTFTPTTPFTFGNAFVPIPGLAPVTIKTRATDYFGTVRGRLGYTFDRVLVYGTGGFAYGETGIGYSVGGGLEYAISNNVTLRGEYLYVNLDRGFSGFNAVFNPATNTLILNEQGGRNSFNVVRAALNYKFDFAAPTVVARY